MRKIYNGKCLCVLTQFFFFLQCFFFIYCIKTLSIYMTVLNNTRRPSYYVFNLRMNKCLIPIGLLKSETKTREKSYYGKKSNPGPKRLLCSQFSWRGCYSGVKLIYNLLKNISGNFKTTMYI